MNPNNTLPRPSQQYMRDCQWIANHIDDLVRTHGNGWIAVSGGRVLAAGPGLSAITDEAEKTGLGDDIVFQFIDDGTLIF